MKKFARLLAAFLALMMLVGCGAKEESNLSQVDEDPMANQFTFAPLPTVGINDWNDEEPTEPAETINPEEKPLLPVDTYTLDSTTNVIANAEDPVRYVMIYNPNIYDEMEQINEKLTTGDFSNFVEAAVIRADGLNEGERTDIPRSVADNAEGFDFSGYEPVADRAEAIVVPFATGDKRDFYCGDGNIKLKSFTCMYAG